MTTRHRKVLAIGLDADDFRVVDQYLSPGGLEVDRFPSVQGALELASSLQLDALLLHYPVADMPLRQFLDRLREPDRESRFAPVVLLTDAATKAEAEHYIGRGANRVLALDRESERLLEAVMGVIFVAPRQVVSFPAQFHLEGSDPGATVACQVRNSSATGALLETGDRPDKGTRIYFRFEMPSIERPVVGVGEVVRHTSPDREDVDGVGIRFLSFAGNSKTIYDSYLNSLEA